MKVLVNGGLNLSVRDGLVGRSLVTRGRVGDRRRSGARRRPAVDRADAEALYAVLENEIIPEFDHRDQLGIPRAWVARIRRSMAVLTPQFSANRTVRQYTEEQYLKGSRRVRGAIRWRGRLSGLAGGDRPQLGRRSLRPASRVTTHEGELAFDVEVRLGRLDPAAVLVELYAGPQPGSPAFREEMQRIASASEAPGVHRYSIRTEATRAAADFTPRILPHHQLALGPEIGRVVWQK